MRLWKTYAKKIFQINNSQDWKTTNHKEYIEIKL